MQPFLSVCLSISPNFGASSPTSTFQQLGSASSSGSTYLCFINYMHLSQFFSSPHIHVKYEKTAKYVKIYINLPLFKFSYLSPHCLEGFGMVFERGNNRRVLSSNCLNVLHTCQHCLNDLLVVITCFILIFLLRSFFSFLLFFRPTSVKFQQICQVSECVTLLSQDFKERC